MAIQATYVETAFQNQAALSQRSNVKDHEAVIYYKVNHEVDTSADCILKFLEDNEEIFATFSTDREALKETLQTKNYLVINKKALSLTASLPFPKGIDTTHLDIHFGGEILEEPVLCPQGHHVEKRLAEIWIQNRGNICPGGEARHVISRRNAPLKVDYLFKTMIKRQKLIDSHSSRHLFFSVIEGAKVVGHAGVIAAPKLLLMVGKSIPLAGAVIQGSAASYHFAKGEYQRGFVATSLGAISCIPFVGMGFSMVGTLYNFTDEQNRINDSKEGFPPLSLNEAYRFFDISTTQEEPSQEEMDTAYDTMIEKIHLEEGVTKRDFHTIEKTTLLKESIEYIRERIYKEQRWSLRQQRSES